MSTEDDTKPVYVLAVSGGVDSVVLLDIMAGRWPKDRLLVAHFDHGIREDSAYDREFVGRLARIYGLEYMATQGKLGSDASEATARDARYDFLRRVKADHRADYIVTAHHQDDLLETAIINLLRGTGRKGLSALRSHGDLYRPLLATPKANILAYARQRRLRWHEDSTNADPRYLRNYVRQQIMAKLDAAGRDRLLAMVGSAADNNRDIDELVDSLLASQNSGSPMARHQLSRQWFRQLPDEVAREIIATWLRRQGIASFDRKAVLRLVDAVRTYQSGKRTDVNGQFVLTVGRDFAEVLPRA